MRLGSIITIIIKPALELQPASADPEKPTVRPEREPALQNPKNTPGRYVTEDRKL